MGIFVDISSLFPRDLPFSPFLFFLSYIAFLYVLFFNNNSLCISYFIISPFPSLSSLVLFPTYFSSSLVLFTTYFSSFSFSYTQKRRDKEVERTYLSLSIA
uniref:Uncharacterized protein n=1 Tax=Cacopsylla melanoneura TaxID=428564 RepID=A0A8D9E9D9_9HEMI